MLAEQVEAANLILVNKIDMATREEVDVAVKVARALNKDAVLHEVEFGKVTPSEILEKGSTGIKTGPMENGNVAEKEKEDAKVCEDVDCTDTSHEHSHAHSCEDVDCTDPSHEHSHDHACEDSDCTDSSHSHSHDHACEDTTCNDPSHSHSHSHEEEEACIDPGCSDTSHSHSHSHATSTDNMGIVNFVYKAARPFQTSRLMALLNSWPVPVKDTLDLETLGDDFDMGDGLIKQDSPFVGVLRSKGFCWMAPSKWSGPNNDAYRHDTAMVRCV